VGQSFTKKYKTSIKKYNILFVSRYSLIILTSDMGLGRALYLDSWFGFWPSFISWPLVWALAELYILTSDVGLAELYILTPGLGFDRALYLGLWFGLWPSFIS
jgi:hypothetical protein